MIDSFESLYFLSTKNDEKLSTPTRIWRTPSNIDGYITHIAQTKQMKMVRNKHLDDFVNNTPDIYYDNTDKTRPWCDVLYRKINKYYYVKNSEYFDEFMTFYFKLYANVFSNFGLKTITMRVAFSDRSSNNINLTVGALSNKIGIHNKLDQSNLNEGVVQMTFEKRNDVDEQNNCKSFNEAEDKRRFLHDLLPVNLKSPIYLESIEIDMVANRTKGRLLKVERSQRARSTDIHEIGGELFTNFGLPVDCGLYAKSSTETTLNQDIEFGLTFYESDVPGQVDTSVTESDRKCGDGVERAPYRMDYGQSRSSFYSGPWPIHCDEIRVQHNVRTTDEAVRIAKEQITLDPENHIIEAREEFVFPADWTTTVKTFRVKGDAVSDVRIGPGRRFVAFDMSKFKHKDNVIKTLRNNSFF